MSISSTLDRLHAQAKQNSWLWLFSIFCRLALAAGFIPSGIVKLIDERFASGLHANHPMGHYLEALHTTGFYYTFIGVVQVAAAIFLLIPRTVTLGAFLYFPIILNITVLTYATRFDGSLFTSPLMTLANLFLLGWNYEKWRRILPFNRPENEFKFENDIEPEASTVGRNGFSQYGFRPLYARLLAIIKRLYNDKFPWLFFAGVFAAVVFFVVVVPGLFDIKPRNTYPKCITQFKNTDRTAAGENFCNCIHTNGERLSKCLRDYDAAPNDARGTP